MWIDRNPYACLPYLSYISVNQGKNNKGIIEASGFWG